MKKKQLFTMSGGDGDDYFNAWFDAMVRDTENLITLLRTMLVKRPHKAGNTIAIDEAAFVATIDHALKLDEETFPRMAGDAARRLDARFFRSAELALRAVSEGQTSKPLVTDAHVAALYNAKWHLEAKHGELPTKREAREYAKTVFLTMFGDHGMKPYTNAEQWKPIFKKAGLEYLPTGVRGKSKNKG